MKQEDKQLLLQDLCARLPYQPLCKKVDTEDDFCNYDAPLGYSLRDLVNNKIIIKPYLRPMESMTEEEWKEYQTLKMTDWVEGDINGVFINAGTITDWLNAHHFDYRGLIPKGLAIEAPEGMYNIKNK